MISTLVPPPKRSHRSIDDLVKHRSFDQQEIERRDSVRHSQCLPARIQPLTIDLVPDGPAIDAVSRDVSSDGVGLLLKEHVINKYLEVTLTVDGAEIEPFVIEVMHETDRGVFYILGGKIVCS